MSPGKRPKRKAWIQPSCHATPAITRITPRLMKNFAIESIPLLYTNNRRLVTCASVLNAIRPFHPEAAHLPEHSGPFQWPAHWMTPSMADTPLDLEIGCGVGWHPIRYASENDGRRLIAIERTRAKFDRFRSRLARHPTLANLLAIHADATRWVPNALVPESIDRCFLLYPNPEPKAPGRRWFRMPFMHRLLATLRPGGEITLATNEEWYWQESLEFATRHWGLEIMEARSYRIGTIPTDDVPRTHFEKKYLARGETCHDTRLRKPGPG